MRENPIKVKSYAFALRIIKMCKYIQKNNKEYILTNQVLRSGTSIGANIEEGCSAQSSKDFIHKLSIAQKEAFETRYWLRLLGDSDEIKKQYCESMIADCNELIKLLTSILKTSKSNLK